MTAAASGIAGTPRSRRLVAGRLVFLGASLSVGSAAFVVLAALAHAGRAGALAAAVAVIGLSFVLAVVPGAIQLRAAADAAAGASHAGLPRRFVLASASAFLIASPMLAEALHAPALAVALLAPGYAVACVAATHRGHAIGRGDHGAASLSMGSEALVRLLVGVGLGRALGATGVALALLLGSATAARVGRGAPSGTVTVGARGVLGPAVAVGALMALVNIDAFAAPRLLGAAGADAYAAAELPARGVFFALFALSWLAVPAAVRASDARTLLAPIAGVAALGAIAAMLLVLARPILALALGAPAPGVALLATLGAAMTAAAALATTVAMGVARAMPAAWAPTLLAAVALGAVIGAVRPGGEGLARLVLAATLAALLVTLANLVRPSRPGLDLRATPVR